MFKEIAEGIEIYKRAVKNYFVECSQVAKREKKSREESGADYCGELDWPPAAYKWKKETEVELSGMAKALGLSSKEMKEIWEEIRQGIKGS